MPLINISFQNRVLMIATTNKDYFNNQRISTTWMKVQLAFADYVITY